MLLISFAVVGLGLHLCMQSKLASFAIRAKGPAVVKRSLVTSCCIFVFFLVLLISIKQASAETKLISSVLANGGSLPTHQYNVPPPPHNKHGHEEHGHKHAGKSGPHTGRHLQ